MAHRTAMIDVGGGFRAIYGAGVMDRMLEDGISVDHCYGVSAGSANMVSFIAKQHGRNHTFYTQLRATPKTAPRSISASPTWATTISTS